MNERTRHIAASVDDSLYVSKCFPDDAYTTDPVDWALAFIKSGDTSPKAVYEWFANAMLAAREGTYDNDPPMPGD